MNGVLAIPLKSFVKGHWWYLHSVSYETPEGEMSVYIYATSIEHARVFLSDLSGSVARVEQLLGQCDE